MLANLCLAGNNERDAEDEPAAVQLIDPFADTQGRLAVFGVIDHLVNLMRLAGAQHVFVVSHKCFGVGFPGQLAVLFSNDVFSG